MGGEEGVEVGEGLEEDVGGVEGFEEEVEVLGWEGEVREEGR